MNQIDSKSFSWCKIPNIFSQACGIFYSERTFKETYSEKRRLSTERAQLSLPKYFSPSNRIYKIHIPLSTTASGIVGLLK